MGMMKMCHILPLTLAAIVSFGSRASAATYYVATTGNDANPGTPDLPWRTLQHAVDSLAPGDTVLVKSGSYLGCRIGNSGQAGAVKTLKAEAGARVAVNAPGPSNKHSSNIEVELFDGTVSYWVIEGFEVANAPHHGIDLRFTSFITVQNCYAHHNGTPTVRGDGVFLAFSDHPMVQNNETSFNSEHGVYHSNSGDYPTIRGNRSHHNSAAGLHFNGDLSQGGDGIISFAVIEKNVIFENGAAGGSAINCDGVSDSIIRNNLIYNNHASGISLYAIDAAEGSSRNKVYNNTIVQPSGARWCINIPASSGVPSPTGNLIKNNILYHPDNNRGAVLIYASGVTGFQSDYNLVVSRFSINGGNSVLSLTQWQGLGYDQHSIISTPGALFVDPSNNNYHLKGGAAAINAGTALAEVLDDFAGLARPQGGAYDIGCEEVAQSSILCVSAASYGGAAVAAESITVAFGTGLATSTLAASTNPLPTLLAGTTVKVKDSSGTERLAPLFFVSSAQVNYQIPPGTTIGTSLVTVTSSDGRTATGSVPIAVAAPGVFAANADGQGVAAAVALRVKADDTQSYEPIALFDSAQNKFVPRPIDLGPDLGNATDQVYLVLFGTGIRARSPLSAVAAKIGGVDAPVLYAGAQGSFVGLDQVNLRVPRSLIGRGQVDLALTVDGQVANTVRVNIQ